MSDNRPTVSVVLLSYNRPDLLREALDSVRAQSYPRLEIIVVDNLSPKSEEVARAVGQSPGVRLVRNDSNLGYAAGMNRGIAAATGSFTYLTEDDIVLDRDCVRRLVEHACGHPATGLASPLMYNKAAGTIRCAGGEFALGGVYRRKNYGEGERDTGQFPRPFEVTCLDGAALFARTRFLQRLGGFREEFFMYGESVELCARVIRAGKKLAVVPAAKVYHFEPPPDANVSPEFDYHRYKNLFALHLLHAPARGLPEFFVRYALWAALRSPFAGRGGALSLFKALRWAAGRAPALLSERRALASQGAEARRRMAGETS